MTGKARLFVRGVIRDESKADDATLTKVLIAADAIDVVFVEGDDVWHHEGGVYRPVQVSTPIWSSNDGTPIGLCVLEEDITNVLGLEIENTAAASAPRRKRR